MRIIDLMELGDRLIPQVAALLLESFRDSSPESWPDMASAMHEVQASLGEGRISRVAFGDQHEVVGWSGAIRQYRGAVWEIYPFIVRPDARAKGVGRALLLDLEAQVKSQNGITMWVGADDEAGQTSLAGVDLYPDVLDHLLKIQNLSRHPYEFYQRMGYTLVGVMPDANGFGKPDIFLAKRVGEAAPPEKGSK